MSALAGAPVPIILPPGWRCAERRIDGAKWIFGEGQGLRHVLSVITSLEAHDGETWLHVSLARPNRMPTYEDMALVKRLFIGSDKLAVQLFVAAKDHVNIHPYCLHLWHSPSLRLPDFTRGSGLL